MKTVTIYSDGACRGNPGPGGWGAFLSSKGSVKDIYGFEPNTTNNRMELTAAIRGLYALKQPCEVELFTDSTYVLKGMTEWLAGWKKKGWKTAAKKPVKNADLWQLLDAQCARHKVNWHWVKGHSGDAGNEKADELANKAIDEKKVAGAMS